MNHKLRSDFNNLTLALILESLQKNAMKEGSMSRLTAPIFLSASLCLMATSSWAGWGFGHSKQPTSELASSKNFELLRQNVRKNLPGYKMNEQLVAFEDMASPTSELFRQIVTSLDSKLEPLYQKRMNSMEDPATEIEYEFYNNMAAVLLLNELSSMDPEDLRLIRNVSTITLAFSSLVPERLWRSVGSASETLPSKIETMKSFNLMFETVLQKQVLQHQSGQPFDALAMSYQAFYQLAESSPETSGSLSLPMVTRLSFLFTDVQNAIIGGSSRLSEAGQTRLRHLVGDENYDKVTVLMGQALQAAKTDFEKHPIRSTLQVVGTISPFFLPKGLALIVAGLSAAAKTSELERFVAVQTIKKVGSTALNSLRSGSEKGLQALSGFGQRFGQGISEKYNAFRCAGVFSKYY